jgi:5-methyltetrahydropteroyltriglutamate--homocysteine methyltransferase
MSIIEQRRQRILTTHVGSLPRQADVTAMMIARMDGRDVDLAQYRNSVAAAVRACIDWQERVGIDIASDGEQSKPSFSDYVHERLGGLQRRVGVLAARTDTREIRQFPEFYARGHSGTRPPGAECVAPLTYAGHEILQEDLNNLKAALDGKSFVDVFVPAASVGTVEGAMIDRHYGDEDALLEAIAEARRTEYEAIVAAGFSVQIDDPRMAMTYMLNPEMSVEDLKRWATRRVEAVNHALRNIPPQRIRHHTCYGINMGPRTNDIEMKHLVGLILSVRANYYSFEFANPRHEHEWTIWSDAKLPEEKVLMPGVITHASVLVEHPELIAQRIKIFADIVGPHRVIASTDCGFASMLRSTPEVHETIVEAKMKSLVEGARLASKRLFGA